MMAFLYAVMRLLAFEKGVRNTAPRMRLVETTDMVEVLAANVCAVLLMAGTMIGLASIFVHIVRFVQALGGGL